MRALFDLFLDICLLRKGPQDLPASWFLLKATVMVYALTSLLAQLMSTEPLLALLQALLDVSLLVGLTYVVLQLLGHQVRFTQTLTALAGAGALMDVIILPVVMWVQRDVASGTQSDLPVLLFPAWQIWRVAVVTHVLRHALSTSMELALLYTLGYLAILITLASLLFP